MITKVKRWKERRQTSNFYEIMVIVDSDGCLIDTTGVSDREGIGICETATPLSNRTTKNIYKEEDVLNNIN
jgi:hypothetical protein